MKKKILYFIGLCTVIAGGWFTLRTPKPADNKFYYAALGDSTTTAFNAGDKWDQKQNSWAMGTDIDSHFMRLKAKFPDKEVIGMNLAYVMVTSEDMVRQAKLAAMRPLNYVTMLIGSNDLCHQERDVGLYKSRILEAIAIMQEASPNVQILLSSLPNIAQARKVAQGKECHMIWEEVMKMCDIGGEIAFKETWLSMNAALKEIASMSENIIFSDAVMTKELKPESISEIDCFHPSLEAQKELAKITWEQGFFVD